MVALNKKIQIIAIFVTIFLFSSHCVNSRCVDQLHMLSNYIVSGEYIYTSCEYSPRAIFSIDKVTEEFHIKDNVESKDEIV